MREEKTCEILVGHAIDKLRTLPDDSVDLVVTSPPYWALRDYKTDPVVFGGDVDCEHEWGEDNTEKGWAYNVPQTERGDDVYPDAEEEKTKHDICNKCGAWRGQLGLEATPDLFADHLVEIFEECRRVLKPTGNLWVNLGDSYMRKSVFKEPDTYGFQKHRDWAGQFRPQEIPEGYKRKDLVGLPWLFAFGARRAGWYLRNDIVWAKSISGPHYRGGACMPEPVIDRCTRSHEYFFHFTKKPKYYYDLEATAEPLADDDESDDGMTRNMRTVWHMNPQPYAGAHFAVYPKRLIEPIIRSCSSDYGCCGDCGRPWIRQVIYKPMDDADVEGIQHDDGWRPDCECHGEIITVDAQIPGRLFLGDWRKEAEKRDGVKGNAGGNTGLIELAKRWGSDSKGEYHGQNTKDYLAHGAEEAATVKARIIKNLSEPKIKTVKVYKSDMALADHPIKPAVVLDPFSGSGTTGIVAMEHGRSYIGIELNPEYAALSEERIKQERTGLTEKKYAEAAVELKEYW